MDESLGRAQFAEIVAKGDTFFLVWAGVLVFFMQVGFCLLETGSVRAKNAPSILLKNTLDACIGAIVWYLVGYGLAYGDDNDGGFIGSGPASFALSPRDWDPSYETQGYDWAFWYFQFTFAAAAATIVSGGVAERCKEVAYLVYAGMVHGIVYPVIAHWVWDKQGFLSAFNAKGSPLFGGAIDLAGSSVVHMTGGFTALIGAAILGPRIGRFDAGGQPVPVKPHQPTLAIFGVFILWAGWYGFNCGSVLALFSGAAPYARDVARVAVCTTLGAAAGGLTVVLLNNARYKVWDVVSAGNGVLAGLVAITAGCSVVDPWAALPIGLIGGLVFHFASKLLLRLRIDDPLDAFSAHGATGLWGVLAPGFFCRPEYSYNQRGSFGLLYVLSEGGEGRADLLGAQVALSVCVIAWVSVVMVPLFFGLRRAGLLRVDPNVERSRMDVDSREHEFSAYDFDELVKDTAIEDGAVWRRDGATPPSRSPFAGAAAFFGGGGMSMSQARKARHLTSSWQRDVRINSRF